MKRPPWLAAFALALALLTACAGAPHLATTTDEIASLRARWLAAFNSRAPGEMAQLYALDAVYAPFSGNRVVSALAIQNLFGRIWAKFTTHMELEPHAVARLGDLAYESGDYRETVTSTRASAAPAEAPTELEGAYVFVARHDAGGWTYVAQAWTDKTEPPQP